MSTEPVVSTASPAARYFAMRPLFPERVIRDVPVAGLTPDGALSDPPQWRRYAEVEPAAWVRRVLADVDRVASLAFGISSGTVPNSLFARELARVVATRDLLATTLTAEVRAVFAPVIDDPAAAASSLAEARRLQQRATAAGLAPVFDASLLVRAEKPEQVWSVSATRPVADGSAAGADRRPDRGGIIGVAVLAEPSSSATGVLLTVEPAPEACGSGELRVAAPRVLEADADGRLDLARLPVPLRTQPETPVILGHSAQASQLAADATPAQTEAGLARWDYQFDFSYELDAWQDEGVVVVRFGGYTPPLVPTPSPVEPVSSGKPDSVAAAGKQAESGAGGALFAALAQYVEVADELFRLLMPAEPPAVAPTRALATFADLVGRVASAWADFAAEPRAFSCEIARDGADDGTSAELRYRLRAEAEIAADGSRVLSTVWVTQPVDVPAGLPAGLSLLVGVEGGGLARWTPDAAATLPGEVCYRAAKAVPVPRGMRLQISLVWPEIELLRWWTAGAEATVERNRHLPGGPQGGAVATGFILRAPTVSLLVPATALVDRPDELVIEDASPGSALVALCARLLGRPLPAPETEADAAVAMNADFGVSWELSYSYPVGTGQPGPEISLPVGQIPRRPLDSSLGSKLDEITQTWMSTSGLTTEGASWRISFALYPPSHVSAAGPDTGAEPTAPLLRVSRLVLPVPASEPKALAQ